jgi:hypothetical protein
MTSNRRDSGRQEYLDERKILIELESRSAQGFDTAVISLSGGALALSISFINQIAGRVPRFKWLLIVAWSSLVFSLIAMTVSHLTSQKAMRKQREIIDQEQDDEGTETGEGVNETAYSGMTDFLNYAALATLLIGLGSLAAFAFLNLK